MTKQQGTKAARQRARRIRWIVLGVVLVAMTAIVTAHQLFPETGKWVGVDALCPFGGLETLYSLLTGDGFIKRTAVSSVILLVGMLAMAVVYRRSFCGTICPLGTLQGIFGAAGRKLFQPALLRAAGHRPPCARYLKYVVLVVFAVWTWQAAELVLRPYDPWAAFAHLTSDELLTTNAIGLGVLVVSLLGSLLYDRFFCKYLCPAGALLALLSQHQRPQHPPRRRRLHLLRPLRQGLHDERRGRDRRRRDQSPSASRATSASTSAPCPARSR